MVIAGFGKLRSSKTGSVLLAAAVAVWLAGNPSFAGSRIDEILEQTGRRVQLFWDQIPSFNCRERVIREKLGNKGKAEFRQELEFDYLALTKMRGENFTVEEVRLPLKTKIDKNEPPSLLETNGFPTLQLIFHPRYQRYYRFHMDEDPIDNEGLVRIEFEHIRGAGSTSAVMVQGRAYALELQGTAWIHSNSGDIQKISTRIISPMTDINVRNFTAEVEYGIRRLPFESEPRWLPARALIELETGLQHWRNVHHYSGYKRFSVESEEIIPKQAQ